MLKKTVITLCILLACIIFLSACGQSPQSIFTPTIKEIRIDGPSMQPTLYSGEKVILDMSAYISEEPQYGDIIVCTFPSSRESFAKRIIGLPGDTIEINEGVFYINGETNTDYFDGIIKDDFDELIVPDDNVFVIGDNMNESRDSRDPSVGPIPYENILGKAISITYPADKARNLY